MIEQTNNAPTADAWHVGRSKLVDAFADLEGALGKLLVRAHVSALGETLGQKVEKLRNAKAGPQFSKAQQQKVVKLLPQVEALIEVRNTVVHAPMKLAIVESTSEAVFLNPKCLLAGKRMGLLLNYDEMLKLTREVAVLTKSLAAPLPPNPASSPPPPSRAAANGP